MTFLLETLRLGLANLMLHKLRSLLTALGIIIGVGAVVAIAAYTEGTKQAALAQFREQGANNIILRSVKPPESTESNDNNEDSGGFGEEESVELLAYGLTRMDHRRLDTQSIQPVDAMVPLKQVGTFVYNHSNSQTVQQARVYGTDYRLPEIVPMTVARGRHLTQVDGQQRATIAVLGADAAQHLFQLEDPLGNTFSIDDHSFTVVGVLNAVGLTTGRDINFDVYIPLETARNLYGDQRMLPGGDRAEVIQLSELIIRVPEIDNVVPVADQVRRVIEVGHVQDDVQVIVPLELIRNEEQSRLMFTVMMIFIASLSLIVGGIGIMNIMLASVTERIREIGVRRAMGATRTHIIAQFLVETTVLSIIGGLLGVLGGLALVGIAAVLANYFESIETPIPTLWSILVGFGAAGVTGILAGLYPAIRAAWEDPIVALRHD